MAADTVRGLAVRATRSSPALPLAEVAASAGVSPKSLTKALSAMDWRGRCAEIAAEAAGSRFEGRREAVWGSGLCPPPAMRAAPDGGEDRTGCRSTAVWSGRRLFGLRLPRSKFAATVCGATSVAERFDCPPAMLAGAVAGSVETAKMLALANASTPAAAVAAGACDHDWEAAYAASRNSGCPPGALTVLARDDDIWVLEAVAGHDNCPATVRTRLARHEDLTVRAAAASSPGCSPEVLALLADDLDAVVIDNVLANPNRTPEVIAAMAANTEPEFRHRAACHPQCDPVTLRLLAADSDDTVREAAASRSSAGSTAR